MEDLVGLENNLEVVPVEEVLGLALLVVAVLLLVVLELVAPAAVGPVAVEASLVAVAAVEEPVAVEASFVDTVAVVDAAQRPVVAVVVESLGSAVYSIPGSDIAVVAVDLIIDSPKVGYLLQSVSVVAVAVSSGVVDSLLSESFAGPPVLVVALR